MSAPSADMVQEMWFNTALILRSRLVDIKWQEAELCTYYLAKMNWCIERMNQVNAQEEEHANDPG